MDQDRVLAQETVGDYRLDLTRLLNMLYMDLEQQLGRADVKANLILTANSILLAASVNVVVWQLRSSEQVVDVLWLLLVLAPALLMSGLAVGYSLSVAYPRLLRVAQMPEAPSSLFSSMAIAESPREDYVQRFLASDLSVVKREVLLGIHAKATILQVKFRRVQRGIAASVAAFGFWLVFVGFVVSSS
jgi:hypothetical protein